MDGSNGINLLDAASSTTTTSVDIIKKVQNSSNGSSAIPTESIDNHQDDDLIRELEQFEGSKKDDDVTLSLPKSSTEANGSNLQDTSDLLKDLESDSPCPGPSESEIEVTPIDSAIGGELMEVDAVKKADDVQVDSTTESSNKRKCSLDSFVESVPKRANIEITTEKANAPDVSNTDTQKSTSEIDSDTESKLLHENSDGEASMSDVVEAITSTSAVTKNSTTNDAASDVKPVVKTTPSNEDLTVSSSGSLESVQSTKDVKKADVSKGEAVKIEKSTESKRDDEVSSNKMNDTTEVTEQDFNETLEADTASDKKVTKELPKSSVKNQPELPALGKTSGTVASSQPDPVCSSESKPSPMEIGNVFIS